MQETKLPAFGLAEEVLAQFMDGADVSWTTNVPQRRRWRMRCSAIW
jgi:hypothetical protein